MTAMLCTCMKPRPMPAISGTEVQMKLSETSIIEGQPGFEDTLQIIWFGSACHEIRLGKLSVVTDPYVTNGLRFRKLVSNETRVKETLGMLHVPAAVLVNHSHHDHLLDAHAALSIKGWENVKLYGGLTSKNIIAGWQQDHVTRRCLDVEPAGIPFIDSAAGKSSDAPPGYELKVTAYPGEHAPHAGKSIVLFGDRVTSPYDKEPDSLDDFKLGEVFNYLIEMKRGDTTFKVFFLGGPGKATALPDLAVDVVILPSPGAKRVDDYPTAHLTRLRPRHIVVNHFNNLFACEPDKARDTQATLLRIDVADLDYFSREIQDAVMKNEVIHKRFERLHLPAISTMQSEGKARNVIHITRKSRTRG